MEMFPGYCQEYLELINLLIQPKEKSILSGLADELLDKKQPGIYNQAIMDFGAVVCKPLPRYVQIASSKKHVLLFLTIK